MRFAFFLPYLRIDDSGFTLDEFFRNLANAVKIASPDNYPYPLYAHSHGGPGDGAGNGRSGTPFNRSDEYHMLFENYLHRYKVLPEERYLVALYKHIYADLDTAYNYPKTLKNRSFKDYLFTYGEFSALKDCLDLVAWYFAGETTNSLDAASGLILLDELFFQKPLDRFPKDLLGICDKYRSSMLARPVYSFEMEVENRYRRDRLHCVLMDENRPLQSSNSFFVHFSAKDETSEIAHIETILSDEELRRLGPDPEDWSEIDAALRRDFDNRFTYSRVEVSLT
ncbi:MAG: hypothetical protein HRF49_07145 [bacterium]|jgi:hypothetical protein